MVSVFIAVFLLFSTGFVYEVLNDHPTSPWLNSSVDYSSYNSREVQGAAWLASIVNPPGAGPFSFARYPYVYADSFRFQVLTSVGLPYAYLEQVGGVAPHGDYVYLGTYNIVSGQLRLSPRTGGGTIASDNTTIGLGKVFDDGGCEIYY